MKPCPYEWWPIPDSAWDACEGLSAERDERSDLAANTRRWSDTFNFVGCLGEACFAHVTGLPQNASPTISDGGEDFPGIDVKGSRYWQDPLLRLALNDRLRAPAYCLVAVDLDGRRARIVGYATRLMVREGPTRNFGHGPSYALGEPDLLSADQLICRLYTEARQRLHIASGPPLVQAV